MQPSRKIMPQPIFRFAPSPNGHLHLGHALSALINDAQAQAIGGQFLLRIEDIDPGRSRRAFIDAIYDDLKWLGLSWPEPVLHQSTRFATYRKAAAKLEDMGLLYPCFATRSQIKAAADPAKCDPDGAPLYPGLHKTSSAEEIERHKANNEPFALRLDMEKAITAARNITGTPTLTYRARSASGTISTVTAHPERWGDAVIMRKDVDASYHLAVVVDDAFQNITHVTRGQDLAAATDIHSLLQILLGLPQPLYHHHRLLTDDTGQKLAKSTKSLSLRALRDAGHSPSDIRRMIGTI